MASFKLNNDCVDVIVDLCMIAQTLITAMTHECNAAAEQLIRLLIDKFHTDNENDVTVYDVDNNGSTICKTKQNYAHATKRFKKVLINSRTDYIIEPVLIATNFLEIAIARNPQTRFAAIKHLSIKAQKVCHKFPVIPTPIITVSILKIQTYQIIYLILMQS